MGVASELAPTFENFDSKCRSYLGSETAVALDSIPNFKFKEEKD